MTPDWMAAAECKGANPDWFHPPDGDPNLKQQGLELCWKCTVKEHCFFYAMSFPQINDQYGVYGGTTPTQRRQIRRYAGETYFMRGK